MLVHGRRCPIVGNISMDLTTLDVTEVSGCRIGDEVVIFGEQAGDRLCVDDLAKWAGTINYEIVTNVSRRVPRFY
jgi:alanine racemase